MPQPAARQGDPVTGTDVHILLVPSPGGPVPTPTPLPFSGTLTGGCVADVLVNGRPVAVQGSTATNAPPHLAPPPATFAKPPTNSGTVLMGSPTVLAGGRAVARLGDQVLTCNDPVDAPTSVIAGGSSEVVVS
jgi:uncharacterized Zn-binding protein involved in type VI secretion